MSKAPNETAQQSERGPLYELLYSEMPTIPDNPTWRVGHAEVWHLRGIEWSDLDLLEDPNVYADPPYAHTGDVGRTPIAAVSADYWAEARSWAEQYIPRHSGYEVDGWDGMVPRLFETRSTLTITMVAGFPVLVALTGKAADSLIDQLTDNPEQNIVPVDVPTDDDTSSRTVFLYKDKIVSIDEHVRIARVYKDV